MARNDRDRFIVRSCGKQRVLLRALNELKIPDETASESRAIAEMVSALEAILERRERNFRTGIGSPKTGTHPLTSRNSRP